MDNRDAEWEWYHRQQEKKDWVVLGPCRFSPEVIRKLQEEHQCEPEQAVAIVLNFIAAPKKDRDRARTSGRTMVVGDVAGKRLRVMLDELTPDEQREHVGAFYDVATAS